MKNYFDVYRELSDKYLLLQLERLEAREKLVGTDCLLLKNRENPYDDMFGKGTTVLDRDNPINIRLIINRNTMINPYNSTMDSIMVYTANESVEIGDVIEYRTRTETIAYKVEALETYNTEKKVFKRLTLVGYRNSG